VLKPLVLVLLLTIGANSSGCAERRSEGPRGAAERDCPTEGPKPDKGSVCIAKSGPNWTYAFVYPAEAARIPSLDSWLRSEAKEDEGDHEESIGSLANYAKQHPEGRFHLERVFKVDADLPGLLALSKETSAYTGGAHGWFVFETLFWDKSRNRELEPGELFSDPSAANSEIQVQLCPILAEPRRVEAARGGGDGVFNGPCAGPPYNMTLLAAGGRVTTLKVTFTELDGYAGGTYEVYVPVTRRLLALVAERFRAGFALSESPPRACNSNVGCVEGLPPQPQ
jgi:hypothetical protein